jgi:predicted CXXCH cytochrome family protein
MTTPSCPRPGSALRHAARGLVLTVLACLALAGLAPAAWAEEVSLSDESKACLKCHDKPALHKTMGDGKKLSLSISGQDFLTSMHKKQDCTDCHSQLDEETHGKRGHETPLKNRRELSQSMQESCRDCHKKTQKTYDDSLHAMLVKGGSDKAPLCADCHNSHTQASVKLLSPIEQTPCASCHEKVFTAYKSDVHGLERVKKGKEAPICADCHKSHGVQAATLGDGVKDACLSCHKQAKEQHKDWLPNAGLHFESISCVACHAPDAQRRINLRLFDAATDQQLREIASMPKFLRRTQDSDEDKLGLNEREMFEVLQEFRQERGAFARVMLRGRLEVTDGIHAHQLADKDKALKDCNTCHSDGASPFQTVVLSIAGADGRPLTHAVQKEALNSLNTLQSVRGFYAIGATRIKLLDWLLLGAVLASIGGCLTHFTILRISRARRAAAAKNPPPAN